MYTVEIDGKTQTLMHPVKSAGTSIHAAIVQASHEYKNYKVHVNQRHAHIRNLPRAYKQHPKYVVIREPHKWYRSFYRFFLGVEGSYSLFLNDPKDPPDGFIYPIDFKDFILRTRNLKKLFLNYPGKARVFRNILRSQGHLHFLTSYFESDFSIEEPQTLEQFDKSLFKWHMDPMGDDCIYIPMNRLDIIEDIFRIKIPHINKTDAKKPEINIDRKIERIIRGFYAGWYQAIENFDENNLITLGEAKEKWNLK